MYEDICVGIAGRGGLLRLVWSVAVKKVRERFGGRDGRTALVSAAPVWALRDDERTGAFGAEV